MLIHQILFGWTEQGAVFLDKKLKPLEPKKGPLARISHSNDGFSLVL